jgi:ankyrin repeat protein
MKAQFVHENLGFERGRDVKQAVGIGMEDALKRALAEDRIYYDDDNISLEWASQSGRKDFIEYLLKKGTDPNVGKPLLGATIPNDIEIYKLLLGAGAKMEQLYTDFDAARNIMHNSKDISQLEYLISQGLDMDQIGKRLLDYAMEKSTADWVKVLIDAGLDISDINLFHYNTSKKPGKYLLDQMSKMAEEKYPKSS